MYIQNYNIPNHFIELQSKSKFLNKKKINPPTTLRYSGSFIKRIYKSTYNQAFYIWINGIIYKYTQR